MSSYFITRRALDSKKHKIFMISLIVECYNLIIKRVLQYNLAYLLSIDWELLLIVRYYMDFLYIVKL